MTAIAARQHDSRFAQPTPVKIPPAVVSPLSSDRHGRYSPGQYGPAFGRGKAARQRRLDWIGLLAEDQKTLRSDGWGVCGSAVLPESSSAGGMTVTAFVQAQTIFQLPKGWASYTEAQRRSWRLNAEREVRFQRFLAEHPHMSKSVPETYMAFANGPDTTWLKDHRLSASKSTMYAALLVLSERREVPRRGRPKGSGKTEWHPRAEHLCDQFFYHTHGRPIDIYRAVRAYAHAERFPAPSERMVRERIGGIPKGAKVLARKGERALDAIAPKGKRPRRSVRGWWSLDCRTEDVFYQRIMAGGELRPGRPTCSGVYVPYSRRWADLRFGTTENGDLISASIAGAARSDGGLARVAQTDNGSFYKTLADEEGTGAFLRMFGVKVILAPPYEGYAKPIESAWNRMKNELDRFVRSFCGGGLPERHEDAHRWARANVHKLPTIDDLNEWACLFMETDNATPAKVLGGLSPNLYAELHGPDRLVVDPDVLDVYFTPSMTKNRKPLSRVVGIDGVLLDNALYLPEPGDLAKLQGRRVWILPDAELADRIILCEQDGAAICHAYADKRAGATNEHRREARRRRERYKRVVRNYIPARDDSLLSDTSRILRVKRDYMLAGERKLRAELGIEDQRGVRIVRSDLAKSAKRLKSRERPRGTGEVQQGSPVGAGEVKQESPAGTAGGAQEGAIATDRDRVDGFARLAQRQEDAERAVTPTCSWADYPAEHEDSGVPAQEADRGAFDRLADVG